MSDVTQEGIKLIDTWLDACAKLESAKRNVTAATQTLEVVEKRLAEWLKPDDAKDGEKIAIWYVDSLIQVEVGDPDKISIRKRGRHL